MSQLPVGFDPDGGTFANVKLPPPRINQRYVEPTFSPGVTYVPPRRNLNWWQRFDRVISNIGNWFSENYEDAVDTVCVWLYWIIVIGCVGAVIATWVDSGFLSAIFVGIGALIGIGIAYYIGEFVLSILIGAFMFVGRFIFWNGFTFLLFLGVLGGGIVYNKFKPVRDDNAIETVQTTPQTYTCNARVLNVRSEPDVSSSVRGSLQKGQEIQVHEIIGDFARIDFNGATGYVALKYLTPKGVSVEDVH